MNNGNQIYTIKSISISVGEIGGKRSNILKSEPVNFKGGCGSIFQMNFPDFPELYNKILSVFIELEKEE